MLYLEVVEYCGLCLAGGHFCQVGVACQGAEQAAGGVQFPLHLHPQCAEARREVGSQHAATRCPVLVKGGTLEIYEVLSPTPVTQLNVFFVRQAEGVQGL